jgi:hypothetical protein
MSPVKFLESHPERGRDNFSLVQLEVARQLTAIKMIARALSLSCLPREFYLKDARLAVKALLQKVELGEAVLSREELLHLSGHSSRASLDVE